MNTLPTSHPKLPAIVAAIALVLGGVACSGKTDSADAAKTDKTETAKPADAAKPADMAKTGKAGAAPAAVKAALTVTAVQPSNNSLALK